MTKWEFIRLKLKAKYDSTDNKNLKKNFMNALPFWMGAFMTGLVAVLYAKLFSLAEMGTKYIFQLGSWYFFIITPTCFALATWLVIKFAPFSRGSGIPQVSAAIDLTTPKQYYKVERLLSLKILFVKIISSLIMVFGGGIIGREGPTIQISAAIFKKINDWLPEWYPKISKRNMLVTGAAAGLASAFNTPLGGIVFAIEELTKTHISFFKSALLTGVIIAGLTALNFLGPYLYLGYPDLDNLSPWLLVVIVPLAVITVIASTEMCNLILFINKKKSSYKKNYHKIIYAILCGLLIAAFAILIDSRMFGSGKEIMVTTLFSKDKKLEWYIPIIRMLGSVFSFTTGAAGGVFAPALSAGASIGSVVAGWLHLSSTSTNLIILCGMAGFLTGVTRSPFTSSILVIEMTNSHSIIFYIMLTALIANLVATFISKHAFYEHLKENFMREIELD